MTPPAILSSSQQVAPPDILVADGLSRTLGGNVVLKDLSVRIRRGEFFTLLGPSGCGKTTLLRIMAGLDAPDAGKLWLLDRDTADWPAHERPVNTVFQSYALFPHLSVKENVAFGLRMKGVRESEIRRRVDASLELVHAESLASRMPHQLSGGQKQRIALARALVNEPRVLLLDEPLAALDPGLRRQLQDELRPLQQKLGMTFVYVTHDQEEAFALSDRIAVLQKGRIAQLGAPRELYNSPLSRDVAEFLGGCNVFGGRAVGGFTVSTSFGVLHVPAGVEKQGECWVGIRHERIRVASQEHPIRPGNRIPARLQKVSWRGSEIRCMFEVEGGTLHTLHSSGAELPPLECGETLELELPPDALMVW